MAGTSLSAPHQTIANTNVILTDLASNSSLILLASGTGAPDTTASVWQHGALFIRTDSGTGSNGVYQNTGSSAVPSWTLLDTGTAFQIPTTSTDASTTTGTSFFLGFTGLTTGNGLSINAYGGTAINTVGGGTQNVVAISGTGNRVANQSLLKVTQASGTPASSSAFLASFDYTGATATNAPVSVNINTGTSTGAAIGIVGAAQSSHYICFMRANGVNYYVGDGTAANANFTGQLGDVLFNGSGNKIEICAANNTTHWLLVTAA